MAVAKKKQEGLSRRASGPLSKPVSTLTVGALEAALLAEVPASDAEGWDRTGMTVGDPARLVEGVAVALDPTVDAEREAASRGANVLLTHHPAYLEAPDAFGPASSGAANPGAGVWAAVEGGVALIALHTALDVSPRAARVLPGMLKLAFKGQVLVPVAGSRRKGYGQLCTVRPEDDPLGHMRRRSGHADDMQVVIFGIGPDPECSQALDDGGHAIGFLHAQLPA